MVKQPIRDVYEVSFSIDRDLIGGGEILRAGLERLGIARKEIIERESQKKAILSVYTNAGRKAQALIHKVKGLPIKKVRSSCRRLKRSQWQDKWKNSIRPFILAEKFIIVPAWHKGSVRLRGKIPVRIDTTLAFGTGLHETTRFASELIVRCEGRFKTFLDIGTGTGILSVIARHCSAQRVDGAESDSLAARVARNNLKANGMRFGRLFCKDFGMWPYKAKYDCVAANLTTDELLRLNKKIWNCVQRGKFLILSGVSQQNVGEIKRMMNAAPFKCLRVLQGKKWVAMLYQHNG